MQTINYTGTWTGNMFTLNAMYDHTQMVMGFPITTHHTVTLTATWMNGCAGWTGNYRERTRDDSGFIDCTLNWNVTGMKL